MKTIDHELEIEKLKSECEKLKIQKNQIEASSRIFLE